MRPPLTSQDTFENRPKNGIDSNLRIEMIDEEADSLLRDATGFRVNLHHHVPINKNGRAEGAPIAAVFLI
jgi:hypothetical protein